MPCGAQFRSRKSEEPPKMSGHLNLNPCATSGCELTVPQPEELSVNQKTFGTKAGERREKEEPTHFN